MLQKPLDYRHTDKFFRMVIVMAWVNVELSQGERANKRTNGQIDGWTLQNLLRPYRIYLCFQKLVSGELHTFILSIFYFMSLFL